AERISFRKVPSHGECLPAEREANVLLLFPGVPGANCRGRIHVSRQGDSQVGLHRVGVSLCALPALREWFVVIRHSRRGRAALRPLPRMLQQGRERRERYELAGREVITKRSKPITTALGVACPRSSTRSVWRPRRFRRVCRRLHLPSRWQINSTPLT